MSNNDNIIRDNYKKLITEKTKLTKLEVDDLEIGVFNASLDYAIENKIQLSWLCSQFVEIYGNIARSVYSNLVSSSYINNKDLIKRLKKKEFCPHDLAKMPREKLYPEKWFSIIEKQKLQLKEAYEFKQVSMSDLIKCGKCKNNKVSYQELQTRSGDESMTIFFTCIVCGHKWKT
jgi:DNA-directed RNA polymerase subunit M/transcription elongation factor TFIIS